MPQKVWSAPDKRDPILAAIPLHRFAELEDMVEPILFLLSDGAAMISGVCLPIDGGVACRPQWLYLLKDASDSMDSEDVVYLCCMGWISKLVSTQRSWRDTKI